MRTALLLLPGAATLAFCLASAAFARAADPLVVYVGTYTDTASKGIYRFTLDPATGKVTEPVLAAESRNPSFLARHPNGRFLYAVGEVSGPDRSGLVRAFVIDPASGALTLLNEQPSGGGGPCHLVVDRDGKHVLVANYGGGSVAVLPIGPDGKVGPPTVTKHEGSGPNQERQKQPHAHGIYFDPAGRFVVSPDLGADRVFVYRFTEGRLEPAGAGKLAPGAGPRHLVFDKAGQRLYVANELDSTVTVFDVANDGALTAAQTISTLPAAGAGKNYPAEIELSPGGRHLYVSNRGHDSIAVFDVDPKTGRLAATGHVPAGGSNPRHFTIDASGTWMLVAHQNDNSIQVFRLDASTGMPSAVGAKLTVGKPVCLLVIPARP